MKKHLVSILLVFLSISTTTFAQPATAPAPVVASPPTPVVLPPMLPSLPPGPAVPPSPPLPPPPPPRRHADITKVLEKASDFTVLLRLLRSTHVADVINAQLGDRSGAVTFFAPPDSAFARLKDGTLNSLSNEKQVELIQFHAVPTYLSATQFQTVSNPLRTDAGGSNISEFPLNVTTNGDEVNIFTGVNSAKVIQTIYADKELAVYEVDKVLQPMGIFAPKKAMAPSPEKPKVDNEPTTTTPEVTTTTSTSDTDKIKCNIAVFNMFIVGLSALFASISL